MLGRFQGRLPGGGGGSLGEWWGEPWPSSLGLGGSSPWDPERPGSGGSGVRPFLLLLVPLPLSPQIPTWPCSHVPGDPAGLPPPTLGSPSGPPPGPAVPTHTGLTPWVASALLTTPLSQKPPWRGRALC